MILICLLYVSIKSVEYCCVNFHLYEYVSHARHFLYSTIARSRLILLHKKFIFTVSYDFCCAHTQTHTQICIICIYRLANRIRGFPDSTFSNYKHTSWHNLLSISSPPDSSVSTSPICPFYLAPYSTPKFLCVFFLLH